MKSDQTTTEVEAFTLPSKEEERDHYELMLLAPGTATEEHVATLSADVKEMISGMGGTTTSEQNFGQKALAYTVAGSRSGVYVVLECDLPKGRVRELNEKLRLRKDVVRFLLVQKRVKTPEELAEEERVRQKIEARKRAKMAKDIVELEEAKARPQAAPSAAPLPSKAAEQKPVQREKPKTLEEIDQEIEKLLSNDIGL